MDPVLLGADKSDLCPEIRFPGRAACDNSRTSGNRPRSRVIVFQAGPWVTIAGVLKIENLERGFVFRRGVFQATPRVTIAVRPETARVLRTKRFLAVLPSDRQKPTCPQPQSRHAPYRRARRHVTARDGGSGGDDPRRVAGVRETVGPHPGARLGDPHR